MTQIWDQITDKIDFNRSGAVQVTYSFIAGIASGTVVSSVGQTISVWELTFFIFVELFLFVAVGLFMPSEDERATDVDEDPAENESGTELQVKRLDDYA
ncbi:hypothetical protein HZS55_09790 [Halosimplex rubrum]|uniref:Uncharacterized protein n=1 Tax=Halosimplex rubrum TaxID=869889 RepID=A0A7D5T4A6_9EURY|nr:hypothetical protein [Halosimplex rubrum]QLH77570.1 hypothetical protein HZS55_09790 [Halosimplex rubrum]